MYRDILLATFYIMNMRLFLIDLSFRRLGVLEDLSFRRLLENFRPEKN